MATFSVFANEDSSDSKYKSAEHSKGAKNGLVEKRSCTDVICLLMIICLWIAMTCVGSLAIEHGDPYRLISPIDDVGDICGYTGAAKDEPYFYTVMTSSVGVCTPSCPIADAPLSSTQPSNYYCLSYIHTLTGNSNSALKTYIANNCMTNGEYDLTLDCGCNIIRETTDVFHRCVFTDPVIRDAYIPLKDAFMVSFMSDIFTARSVIFGFGVMFSLCMCFLWTHLLHYKYFGMILCWGSITGVLVMMSVLAYVANTTADEWEGQDPAEHTSREIDALRGFSSVMVGLSVIFACLMVFLRKQINLSIKVIALAAGVIEDMPLIVFTPLIQLSGFILFLMPWFAYCIYIASDGHYETAPVSSLPGAPSATQFVPAESVGGRLWFMLFCFLWTMNFCTMIGTLVLALCTAMWYFTPPAERHSKIGNSTICSAYYIAFRYHLGTVAFGACIIAIIQFIRAVVLYIEKHSKKIKGNPVAKVIFCCIDCCLWCLEKVLKFISKNAYIQTAIHGTKFLSSCKAAFFAIARNIARIGSVHVASTAALVVGKVFVVCMSAACAYYILDTEYAERISGFVAPTLLVLLLALMVVTMFMDVFHMVIDSMLMCYITDEECNDGKAVYASAESTAFINEHGLSEKDKKALAKRDSERLGKDGAAAADGDESKEKGVTSTELVETQQEAL